MFYSYMHPAQNMYHVRPSFFYSIRPPETILSAFRLFLKYNILSLVLQTV